ncbi:MAG: amidohydrolase [Verrucomicrobiota bacterium]|nr:amidohydrolase [Verrucomicrobiota bacterium]
MALGSDYPFPLGEAHPGELIESMADFSAEDKARLLSGSAREFLGLR